MVCLSLVAFAAIFLLQSRTHAALDARAKLADLHNELDEIQSVSSGRALATREQYIRRVLAGMLQDSPPRVLEDAPRLVSANFDALQRIRILLISRPADVPDATQAQVSRTASDLAAVLSRAGDEYERRAAQSLDQATVGSALVILALLTAFGIVYRISVRARGGAESLAGALRSSEHHLAEAQRLAAVGSWEWHPADRGLVWSVEQARLHGADGEAPPQTIDAWLELIAAEDRGELSQALSSGLRDGAPISLEYRIGGEEGTRLIHCQAVALAQHDGRIEGLIGTCQDVTERFRRVEAERASQAKNEFLSRMSHELRTPLNAILGFGQLLEMSELADRQRGNVRHVMKAGAHLLDLINEVLDISRIESRELRLSLEPVHIASLVTELVDLIEPTATSRHIAIEVLAGDGELWALADLQRLKQVLLNLLSNAVKYNVVGGRVEVQVNLTGAGRVAIAVADHGRGIEPELISRLFSPFDRLGAEATGVEGTGLGLALSKGFVEAMGGAITARSTPGEGSEFVVELDAAEPTVVAAPEPAPRSREGDDASEHRTVLCIEDNPSNLALLQHVLHSRPNVNLVSAIQGTIGLELAREHRPDLVLLDLNLPDVSGAEVLADLRTHPATKSLRVVIVTADATEHQRERLLAAGADGCLTKPLDVTQLLRIVDDSPSTPAGCPA
jgi:signal transduction histidine kinase/CheY-like chemotaxis protein